ncbi:type III-B CRISPR module-associated protein Cmr5 [Phototrophicus methaneseepsis]|uniref:CRISPR type III-B/RAMP module-associated protein Cmr5 n=1 Tax=Phototrophicus methaneseepsis TaxID=2710758 RepID=A0A7S8E5U4_9CHLR|nr:type III-B CRISPR module-associated protein Cmr5 [Phototrophicus methaneseepsis]QPC80934.1 type III-B CRISPR module-associated protein Cmr5 [Phototrophicus methaneseepsis]
MATIRQTLEQERASSAWRDIETVTNDQQQKKYGTLARKLPTMIQMNGLGTTLAFLMAKGKSKSDDGHTLIFNHLSKWVLSKIEPAGKYKDLMVLVRNVETDVYRRATTEAIEYGIWLKRYVEAKDWGSADGDDSP